MKPIQWHLKNKWRVPESSLKGYPYPKVTPSSFKMVAAFFVSFYIFQGQPYPFSHAMPIFADTSKEEWGAHFREHTARGNWSLPENKLHINDLKLKAVFLALKEFQDFCSGKITIVATSNTTVIAYINKEGGMSSGPLSALLWRRLS